MTAFFARLGNLCWWTACAVNVLFGIWLSWAGGDDLNDGDTWLFVVAFMAIIQAIGWGLRYLFAGKLTD